MAEAKKHHRLWLVAVEVEMYVSAETKEKAEEIAFDSVRYEITDSDNHGSVSHVSELTDIRQVDKDSRDTLPWRGKDDNENASIEEILGPPVDPSPDPTIRHLMELKAAKEQFKASQRPPTPGTPYPND